MFKVEEVPLPYNVHDSKFQCIKSKPKYFYIL